ncbi:MAG: hypothetical protein M3362_00375 [Acidobacteriota bacterium]|nr:hypothetical protein [Acidobacteriota bacterium]
MMDIILVTTSLLLGGVIGWLISRYYYRKQTRQLIDPAPQIGGFHQALMELHDLSLEREDKELEKGIKKLIVTMLHTRMRVLDSVASGRLLLAMIDDLRASEDKDKIVTDLNELGAMIKSISSGLGEIGNEFDSLHEVGEQIYGKKFQFTSEEFDKFLVDPQNSRRPPKQNK